MHRISITLSLALFLLSSPTTSSLAQNPFQNATPVAAAAGYSIAPLTGDYDGDGDIDILGTGAYILNATSGNATVLLRNDGGSFVAVSLQLPSFYFGGMYQWADLDNDNDLDIIAGGCTYYCYNTKMLSIYRNDGADNFTLITTPTNLIGGKVFSLADYDNDGLIDIEIATQSDNDDSVIGHTFYKNTGNFVFQSTFQLPVSNGEAAWGDYNNDGWNDFVLYDHVYKNMHDGTFQPFATTITMQQHITHFPFDADNDGDLDVITDNGILMVNDGNGAFSFGPRLIPYVYVNSLVIADFDGDGNKDMVASGAANSNQVTTQFFHSNDDGTFTTVNLNDQYPSSYDMAVADMDNDKDPDIILSAQDVIILENALTPGLSKPGVPAHLQASANANEVTFSWDAATDPQQSSLDYNMYLMYGDNFKIVPNADTVTGAAFLPGLTNIGLAVQRQIPVSELPEGYYRWSVQSVDAELNASPFATPQEFTLYKNNPANAPTNLTATAIADHSISLTWADNSSDETDFTIERSSVDGNTGFQAIDQVASNTVSYNDNSVSPRTLYYYRIRLDGSAAIAYSNVIRVETKPTIGIAPASATATALNSASAKLEWQYSGTGITGFVIERSPDDKKNFAAIASTSADQLTYTDLQLQSGRTYYYRLFAVSGGDISDYSNITVVTVPLKEFNRTALPSLAYSSTFLMGGIAWGDYDNDGNDDLFLAFKAQLFHNKGDGTFEQINETGITYTPAFNFVATWGDYDNDGWLDLFYSTDQDKSSLYRGHGDGTFTKVVTAINGDLSDVTNATWSDFDMDGDLDLSLSGLYIYRYDGNDTFVRVDFPGGLSTGYIDSSVASWADYDDDGDPDVFLGNYGQDEFFKNNGDGSFTAVTDQRITKDDDYEDATPTALWTDFNNDRRLDLTVFHAEGPIYAYANHANTFDSAFYSFEYDREQWKNMFWTDYDNDGDLDLFAMGQYNVKTDIWENRDQTLRQLKGGPLYDYVRTDANFSWNDFDNDGYPDLFEFDAGHQILKNPSNGNSWIKVRLKGRDSNSSGLGAKVFVKSSNHWQRSDVTTHHSYRVQQGFMSVFGLGSATVVDSVKVLWPSGNRQYLTHVDVNQVILIDESQAQEKVTQAPSNLTAEVVYPSSIILKWTDRSADEAGFVIEMATANGQFSEAGNVGANITSFEAGGLIVGATYTFRVRAATGNGRFTNTVSAQIRLFHEVFAGDLTTYQSKPAGLAWGDPDNDGDPDLFVGSQSFEPDAIYYNDHGSFTRKYLRNASNESRQAQWIDYDNDGYQDLHVSVGGGIATVPEYLNDFLYKNDGAGQLVEQTGHVLAQDGYPDFTAAWGDVNKDGYLDMITPRPDGQSSVFLNSAGNLAPQQGSLGLTFQPDGGIVLLSDLNNDRSLDLFATSSFGFQTSVFINGNGQFSAAASPGFPGSLSAFVLEDFDNDGAQDIMAIDQSQTLRMFLFDPVSGKFSEKTAVFPAFGSVTKLSAGDFDNNGFLDVFVTGFINNTVNTNRIFLNNGNFQFTSVADTMLTRNLTGTAIADANKDGHLDVVALATDKNYNTLRYLLQGNKNENHWLRVKPKGGALNKFGIGARIRLFAGQTAEVREIRSGAGGTFSDEQIAHFGLGPATTIDYLKVEWPSGENQWIANPPIDTEMVVEMENTSGPPPPADPSNLTASMGTSGYIGMQWTDNSDNEKLFRIERAIGPASFERLATVPADTTSYVDSTYANYGGPAINIRYRVVAISYVLLESAPSNEATVAVTPPASPSNLAAAYRIPGYIDLHWTDNGSDEKLFRIDRAILPGNYQHLRDVPANTTSYIDSTFVNSSNPLNVKYRVESVSNLTLVSVPSNEVTLSVITGVEAGRAGLTIYPQPASSKVFIRSDDLIQRITIFTALGESVADKSFQGSREVEFPLNGLAPGVYVIRIIDDRGTSGKKLLVIPGN